MISKESLKTGIGAGFLSSLCCTGPLLFLLIGLGSVGIGSQLPRYKPFFITLGAVFLVIGIYRKVKKKHGVCSGTTLKKEMKMILISILTAIVVWALLLYVIVPILMPLVS